MAERLTDSLVKALLAPIKGNKLTYDDEIKGFAVRVTSGGARAFILNYRANGRERRYTIGSFPDWKTVQARKEAAELKRLVDRGEYPMRERHEERAAPLMGELIDRFLSDHVPRKRNSTRRDYTALLEKEVRPAFGRDKVAELRHTDIDKLHRKITERAPYQANRMVAVMSRMMNFAIKLGWRSDNPTMGIERNPEDRRERYLSPEELGYVSIALQEHGDQRSADAIRLLLLTGARRGEVMAASWDMFDLAAGVWVKPSAHTKQKKIHRVPLSPPTVTLLKAIRDRQSAEETQARQEGKPVTPQRFPFPGGKTGAPLTDLKKSWATIRAKATVMIWANDPSSLAGQLVAELRSTMPADKKAQLPALADCLVLAKAEGIALPPGLTDVRIHDLRHSFASMLVSHGHALPVISALLGHTQAQTTARYTHLYDDVLRSATNVVGAMITASGR